MKEQPNAKLYPGDPPSGSMASITSEVIWQRQRVKALEANQKYLVICIISLMLSQAIMACKYFLIF
ncbi:hypothetical protein [Rubinisphaera sp.]|uniref:hypothetical protein n=1 Tax=Rubinisphaera sp. TaxID=2024857 RepID=UPI000C0D31E6|nr:hypothetical protein [Rubinisphaera sp.]MBV09008.1 hypothetical protein [Rubinisphaera sp.]HCS53260.1 hypothetical protein [Planctomycetaceae bacterium]|tara:strand:- start:377 stop:574 length:198 start_codon:yes stop_codon:yes gene_type:complete